MRDPITDAAQDSSCLLCLTPDRGGSWWSRLRPAQLRNFAADPMTFTDSYTAQDGIGTDDFTLSVDFTLLRKNVPGTINIGCMQCIYYDSTKGHQPCVRILKSDGTKDALYPVGTSHILENVASIKVIKTGQNVRMVVHARDGSTVKDQTKPLPDGATVTSLSGATTYPGNIFAASIRNDTTGTAVWQAAYSDLYAIYEPRNFADNPIAWTGAKPALDVTDQSHDFTFEIEFKCVKTNAVYVFASDTSRDFIRVFMSGGEVIVSTALLSTASGGSTQFSAGSDSTNRHVLTVKMIENTITALIDGEIVYTRENLVRNAIEISAPRSNAGYVYKISITDDTTGEIVWQAAHSNLYTMLPPPPWPSPVPRNFAEEPATWYDFQARAIAVSPINYTMTLRVLIPDTDGYIWSASGASAVFTARRSGQNVIVSMQPGTANYGQTTINDVASGEHTLVWSKSGTTATIYLDGELVVNFAGVAGDTQWASRVVPETNVGTILYAELKDDAANEIVWRYPSEAERVRLITKTNVRTDRGGFETVDASVISRIATQLDLRGAYAEKTFIADCWFPATTNNGTLHYFPVITQGDGLSGSGSSLVVNLSVQADYRASAVSRRLQLTWADASGSIHTTNVGVTDAFFGKRHRIVGVIRPGASSAQYTNELYIDGELVGRGSGSVSSFVFGKAAAASIAPGNLHLIERDYTGFLSQSSLLYGALIFDRALSAAEIAALTPKKQPLSWAGIRDVVRRGRAQRYFADGEVLTVATPRWTIEYEVVGFDQIEPADAALTHSMTLLPVRLVTNLQFDAPEPGNPDVNRAQYGCNRWDWSSIRQWLNSAAAPGEWWTAQHEYDAAPAYAATLAGFMADLPADFLSAVAPARLTTALSNAYGGGSVETVDRFWPPSRTEIFGDANNGVAEGVLMTKYVDATDADRIKYEASGSARSWWLRSPSDDAARLSATSVSGTRGTAFTTNTYGVAAACIIA